ncbi:MAG: WecB/TagA/CpsF family glycosyltransferase [Chloroflexota bacterium]|nr:MAG: WecB/TagA/CpsF family glycosyltransferase [Chloroflexota bacterium]
MDGSTGRSVRILGCRVDDVTMAEAVARCDALIASDRPADVITPNAEIVMATRRDDALRQSIERCALSIPDGAGLLLAGRILGTPLREQVAGTDLCVELAALAEKRGYSLFLLGGRAGVAEAAAGRLRAVHPTLRIVGVYSGDASPAGDAAARHRIRAAGPVDILFVAFGAPRQEAWIARNQAELGVRLAIGCGGALDFISGKVARAPRWVRRAGFDWLYRLIRQPWRWRRQRALPLFVVAVLMSAIRRRFASP